MKPTLILAFSCSFLAVGLGILTTGECSTLTGALGFLCLLLGGILLDIYTLKPSKKHTAGSLLEEYILRRVVYVIGNYCLRKLLRSCRDCQKEQAMLLEKILKQNKDTRFSKDNGLTAVRTVEDFRCCMPLTRYSHYEKYIETITQTGDKNVLFPYDVDYICLTSGTTKGKSKGYPKSYKIRNHNLTPWLLVMSLNMINIPGCSFLKRMFHITPRVKPSKTVSGIEQGPMSYYMTGNKSPSSLVVPPCPTMHEDTCVYVHLLFGLAQDDVVSVSTITTVTLLALFTTLERRWPSLCDDIEHGTLSSSLQIDPELRAELTKHLQKDPARAHFLRSEFKKGFKDIVRRIWPLCRCAFAIRTGSFQTQGRLLRERFIGGLPVCSVLHGGTESMYGLNLDLLAEDVRYTLLVGVGFFEFIPEADMDSDDPATLLAHQLEVGQKYEIVLTAMEGLYRYRTEDIIQVTGYRDTAPVYQFIRRAGDILSTNQEKVPEILLYESLTVAARHWNNTTVVDFTSVENALVEEITGHVTGTGFYIVFLEMGDGDMVSTAEKDQVDLELQSRHEVYAVVRGNGKMEPVKIVQVKPGTFDKVKTFMLQLNKEAFFMQYKLPRITRRKDVLKLLLEQAYPSQI